MVHRNLQGLLELVHSQGRERQSTGFLGYLVKSMLITTDQINYYQRVQRFLGMGRQMNNKPAQLDKKTGRLVHLALILCASSDGCVGGTQTAIEASVKPHKG